MLKEAQSISVVYISISLYPTASPATLLAFKNQSPKQGQILQGRLNRQWTSRRHDSRHRMARTSSVNMSIGQSRDVCVHAMLHVFKMSRYAKRIILLPPDIVVFLMLAFRYMSQLRVPCQLATSPWMSLTMLAKARKINWWRSRLETIPRSQVRRLWTNVDIEHHTSKGTHEQSDSLVLSTVK